MILVQMVPVHCIITSHDLKIDFEKEYIKAYKTQLTGKLIFYTSDLNEKIMWKFGYSLG